MKIISFEKEYGASIDTKTTKFTVNRILLDANDIRTGYMYLGRDDKIPFHEALADQLFMIVSGEGWVCDEDENRISLSSGKAAFWKTGEFHAAGTDTQMSAFVIEGKNLNAQNVPVLKNVIKSE
ncbi:hypothetical protein [Oceanobacillus neutriphilus]|uniref:Cupin n=1 Tax=Oceanobacillus neutriphilus TaxID=531815 RepID=A0ABQ2NQ53_9BACI|nr:hypothetical protein [Oceanobacillus neutriphilus]GGP09016.1 hypothetical protein GCM10011346_11380 [Oceanobacillus neutriphilus]